MSPLTILLPCHSHNGCTYHAHWSQAPPAAAQNSNTPTRASTPVSHPSPIQQLPAELLLNITKDLRPIEQASLALTCRLFASTLGPSIWPAVSQAGTASWRDHDDVLDLLQRDLPSVEWWRCRMCMMFHARSKAAPIEDAARSSFHLRNMLPFKTSPSSHPDTPRGLALGAAAEPLYTVDFSLVRAVMDRHFGARRYDGLCLHSLQCARKRTWPVTQIDDIVVEYSFLPKIVLDRLLLRATYTLWSKRNMYVQNMVLSDLSIADFLRDMHFKTCNHCFAGEVLRGLMRPAAPSERAPLRSRCAFCPTQSIAYVLSNGGICIRTWQNLGSGRDAKDRRWVHLSSGVAEAKKYAWGSEDVQEAFERILCSTRDEFERQVEISDGRGTWYDPQLEKSVYKTLPTSVAEAL
ncbi:hypothetical protein EJ04DRAFT_513074 [Polyplosphaeria fusca]|uniref:F-box domain-containing protein n=1 Tax=Polyplosphaeria fusca TaxID=682080 RepID=A0A9P4QZ53_9PLEO|nr:hypothetical protein EJ04DRAFT_513074 [Polyplosphaeria fusca]